MRIAIIGTGYVGLVSAACFAELGHEVIGVDIDPKKIAKLKKGESPIYEPGLEELLKKNLGNGRLSFTTEIRDALPSIQILFSAVATPQGEDHKADLKAIFAVTQSVADSIDHDLIFVTKSTVPVGTGKKCEEMIEETLKKRGLSINVPVISNPEFLREGMAVGDTLMPDRVIIGINDDTHAKKMMEELYKPITRVGKPLVFMNRESAEIVKYASNAFLATKISFINMLTELCEKTGANIRDIAHGMGLDDRIGPRFLHAGIGYGGSCFPKDVKALMALAKEYGILMPIINATDEVNTQQRARFIKKILEVLPQKSTVAVWGLAFKPKTDDMRDAPSADVITALIAAGHAVKAFDPAAMETAKGVMPKELMYASSPLDAATDSDAVILLTEWDEFRGVDLKALKKAMKGALFFDGRNVYESKEVQSLGLAYLGIGI
jgi:UDPglucose 6-dehydrogenase